jgi:hypothetical protein
MWEGWAMGAGIDAGFITMEIAQLCTISDAVRRSVTRFVGPAIVATLAASPVMNAFSFSSTLAGPMIYAAITLGLAIPALIYVLTVVAFGGTVITRDERTTVCP